MPQRADHPHQELSLMTTTVTDRRLRTLGFDVIGSGGGLALIGALAWWTGQPLLFPSLGPTLLLVLYSPTQPSARPQNVLIGHYVGVAAGLLAIWVTGLVGAPPVTEAGTDGPRVVAAAVALALTAVVLRLLDRSHPPAGATTLIIALGLLDSASEVAAMAVSILLLTALCKLLELVRPRLI
jgi:CBS domain-containing membrane protein